MCVDIGVEGVLVFLLLSEQVIFCEQANRVRLYVIYTILQTNGTWFFIYSRSMIWSCLFILFVLVVSVKAKLLHCGAFVSDLI